MVEFAIMALPLLVAGLLVLETARWHVVRQMLNLALLEAARAGATSHGRPAVMDAAFEQALLPLFHPPGSHGSPQARMRAAFLDVTRQTGLLPWRIDVVSPSARAFDDFRDAGLRVDIAPGLPVIRNDYQAEQHARRRGLGWPGGRGPASGLTIFDANTLQLRLTYIHRPLVPGAGAILRTLARAAPGYDAALGAGMLTFVMQLALPMQSHPVQWSGLAAAPGARPGATSAPRPWRPSGSAASDVAGTAPAGKSSLGIPAAVYGDTVGAPAAATADAHAADGPTSEQADPEACGVLLCCLP
jgi:hypothetical protein